MDMTKNEPISEKKIEPFVLHTFGSWLPLKLKQLLNYVLNGFYNLSNKICSSVLYHCKLLYK